jgi:Zincin-like metallopeptidase
MRGAAFGDTPLAPGGVPARRTPAESFDQVALRIMRAVVGRWTDQLGPVELAVEEVPVIPPHWASTTVPLSSYVEATATRPPRLVLFRRPIEHRAETLADLEAMLLTVIVEQLAEVLGLPVDEVLPGYEDDEDD